MAKPLLLRELLGHMQKFRAKTRNCLRFRDLYIMWNSDFATPWHTKMAINHSILKVQVSYFICKPNFVRRKIHILEARSTTTFSMSSFFWGTRRKELGGNELTETLNGISFLIFRKSQDVSNQYIHEFRSNPHCQRKWIKTPSETFWYVVGRVDLLI